MKMSLGVSWFLEHLDIDCNPISCNREKISSYLYCQFNSADNLQLLSHSCPETIQQEEIEGGILTS